MRLLYVEDDERLAKAVKRGLEEERYAVDWAMDGEEALFQAENCSYDLILLDRMLPRMNGMEFLQAFRSKGYRTPVILLTALGTVAERVEGFNYGADDYLVKPFAFEELLVRIRSVIRRCSGLANDRVEIADLVVDLDRKWVCRNTRTIELTAREFSMLEYLIHNRDRVISRAQLIGHLYDDSFDKDSNLIDVFIHKLRKKIDSGSPVKLIHTVRGAGYLFSATRGEDAV
ncbi:MAG: response regulator transcription factor [Magnetococcales bacterium]|nr:response regulator transcription factor [Magnetococcales bacterium]MBF0157649.1 response regulator transcription factor [Magnetococcales bacterium]